MLIPLLLLFFGFFTKETIQRKLVKNKIPFEYLITRNSSNASVLMDKPFDKESSDFFDSFCKDVDCYAAVFKDDTNTQYYQMLKNLENDGFDLSFKFGLNFTASDYLYTIAFLLDSGSNTCDGGSNNLDFSIPDCPRNGSFGYGLFQKWFSFTRTNGKVYCYFLSDTVYNRADGINYCQKNGANITGFQTIDERNFLATTLMKIPTILYLSNRRTSKFRLHIGAERNNDSASCINNENAVFESKSQACDNDVFSWYDYIPLSGESEPVNILISDNIDNHSRDEMCLTFQEDNSLTDYGCDKELQVLCGEYADSMAETRHYEESD